MFRLSLGPGAHVAADAHEIHKTTQNTRDQNKTLSVLWACTAQNLPLKQQQKFAPCLDILQSQEYFHMQACATANLTCLNQKINWVHMLLP